MSWGMLMLVLISIWTPLAGEEPPTEMPFTYQDQQWNLPLRDIGFDGIDPVTIDRKAFFHWLHENIENRVNQPARSAYFRDGRCVSHQIGIQVDRKTLDDWLDVIHEVIHHPRPLPVLISKPSLTTKQCERLKEKRLAFYSTRFNARNTNRTHNIALSSKAIDHHIVFPGQTFSFNQVVGERTIRRGYRQARVIVKGEYSEGIGGGICQTSSTLFNSIDKAGLEILERVSHSKRVTYVPIKRDAAVSWGGPDLRFRNQLNEPIVITSEISHGRMNISIYGPNTIYHQAKSIPPPPH